MLNFAKVFKYEESVAALSAMSGVKVETLDRLISGDRDDPILVAGKTIGLEWATVRALIMLRLGPNRTAAPADIEVARTNYARLMPSTAERVVNFWKTRPVGLAAAIANCSPTRKRRAIIRAEDAAQRRYFGECENADGRPDSIACRQDPRRRVHRHRSMRRAPNWSKD